MLSLHMRVVILCFLAITVGISSLYYSAVFRKEEDLVVGLEEILPPTLLVEPWKSTTATSCTTEPTQTGSWDSSNVLNGPPTKRYRDNLRVDKNYMTSWTKGGLTNLFMSSVNMVYLALQTDRIPIIPPFAPDDHIPASAGILPFGDVFNLTQLRTVLRTPILEWREVKQLPFNSSVEVYSPPEMEHLGCWSTRSYSIEEPVKNENLVKHLGLDVSYTRVPPNIHRLGDGNDDHVIFSPLTALTYPFNPSTRPDMHPLMMSSPLGYELPPDEHLACFDLMYYASSGWERYEWNYAWSPAWRFVGRYLRFTEPLRDLTNGYLRRTFGISAKDLPPFIAVHARRGDFVGQCWDTPGECLPPLSVYNQHVQDIQKELRDMRDMEVHDILITSDETDPAFWEEVKALGWKRVDHIEEKTAELYGEWYEPLVDIVAQSSAIGFVGTDDSTFSLLSKRRVEDWNGGFTRMVVKGGY